MFLLFLLGVFPASIPWGFRGCVDKSYVLEITKTLRLYNTSTSKGVHLTQPTRPSSFSTYACFRNLWVKKAPNGNRNAKTTVSDLNFPKKKNMNECPLKRDLLLKGNLHLPTSLVFQGLCEMLREFFLINL